MSPQWIALIGSSIGVFGLKYIGSSIPQSWLSHPRIQQINNYMKLLEGHDGILINFGSTNLEFVHEKCNPVSQDLE